MQTIDLKNLFLHEKVHFIELTQTIGAQKQVINILNWGNTDYIHDAIAESIRD